MAITVINDNDDYYVTLFSSNKKSLVVVIESPPNGWGCPPNLIDSKTLIPLARSFTDYHDVVLISSRDMTNLFDLDMKEDFIKIGEMAKLYDHVAGFFVCGGAVPGLFYSKLINYDKILLESARFLPQWIGQDEVKITRYTHCNVDYDTLNMDAKYYIYLNKNNKFDCDHIDWLTEKVKPESLELFEDEEGTEVHPLFNTLGKRKYFKELLVRISKMIANG